MDFGNSGRGDKADGPMRRRPGLHRRKKVCVFCTETIDPYTLYRDTKEVTVELFTWEKLDYVEQIKKCFFA